MSDADWLNDLLAQIAGAGDYCLVVVAGEVKTLVRLLRQEDRGWRVELENGGHGWVPTKYLSCKLTAMEVLAWSSRLSS